MVVADCMKRWFLDTLKEAKAGDNAMQVLIGQMYYSGYGVRKDPRKQEVRECGLSAFLSLPPPPLLSSTMVSQLYTLPSFSSFVSKIYDMFALFYLMDIYIFLIVQIIPEKNRKEICKYLFQEGVCYAKKDFNLAKHPEIDVPNLQVIKLMQSFKSREYVRETFAWMHHYWFLTNDGIEFLRTYLNLPSEIVPATLKKQAKPAGSRPYGGPPGDRPRGPPRFDGERRFGGDRDGYRGGPRGPGGEFGGDKGGAPADYRPSFGGPGGRSGFGRGAGGYGAPTSSNA
ncbi:hypothetical protein RIF29_37460 [Crotalaria pallida]|uniref:Plectin/eS10 N-terminal domain-containing protein n=1 Tax=Crotalaria pallida TaxID=3830 RepID=A0AAN9HWB8_CROPI